MACPDESLSDSGIKRDDMLFINTTAEPKEGDIIVVFYDGHTLLRYFYPGQETGVVTLKADLNLLGKDTFSTDEINIIGKLEGKYTRF
jgi:repressor LexA